MTSVLDGLRPLAFSLPPDLEVSYAAAIQGRYLWHEFGDVHLILP